jgi:hypothetical protein
MIDDIGMGKYIADELSLILLIIAIGGGLILLLLKHRYMSLIWTSIFLNILSVFYFMGISGVVLVAINFYIWPLVSLLLAVILFLKYKNKNEKR